MITPNNRKKKHVVLIADEEKSPIGMYAILSEDHDTACHRAEIMHGFGTFLALNKQQARQVCKDLKRYLQNW
jgi:hypothetical protein